MILHLSPDAPWIARAAADTALFAHIGGGILGVAAGFVALAARKGQTIHRAAGTAFFAAMLIAYAVGAAVAPLIHQPGNTFGGLMAIYLLVSGRSAARRPARGDDARRIRRHLWRMCAAMFIGTGSLFLGQPKIFPEGLRGSPILWILAFAPLAAMAFWLIRIRAHRPAHPADPFTPPQEAVS